MLTTFRSFSFTCIIIALFVLNVGNCQTDTIKATLKNIPADGLLHFLELAAKYGHPARSFNVPTKDGYILELFNIPGKKEKPVLMMHGVFDSAAGWIIRGNTSLAIMLANEQYDVWLINFRGNRYSRMHESLDPDKDTKFWDFSAHEFGTYDLPACIDYVLMSTGQKQLSLIGFSEGTTATFVLGSTQTEYNDKVKVFIALAPVAYLQNVRSGLFFIVQVSPFLDFILPQSYVEVSGYYSLTKAMLNLLCTQLVIGYELCYQGGMNSVSGVETNGIERDFFPVVIGHFPSGTSRKNLMHFSQISLRKSFSMYDYGTTKNLNIYRSFTPPEYDVRKVTMKTVLVVAENDPVSTIQDVELLKEKLPNVVKYMVIENSKYNHLDHVWSKDACNIEYPEVINILRKYL